jgi:hypothetical protein
LVDRDLAVRLSKKNSESILSFADSKENLMAFKCVRGKIEGLTDIHRPSDAERLKARREGQVLFHTSENPLAYHHWCSLIILLDCGLASRPTVTLGIIEDVNSHSSMS